MWVAIVGFLSVLFGQSVTAVVIRIIAIKVILFTLFTVILPIVLFNVWMKIQYNVFEYVISKVDSLTGGLSPAVVQFTGIAGWIASEINLVQAMMVIMSAGVTSFAMRMIRR